MSVFALPDGRPFMAGTYYPPEDRPGLVGFPRLLAAMAEAWITQRDTVLRQASDLERAMQREISFIDHLAPHHEPLDLSVARHEMRRDLVSRSDVEGGFGTAPKFPRASYVEALLEYDDPETIDVVERTLAAMSRRGLYDHLEGGFARYSVDAQWHVPHFEKMLSDQALLARAFVRADRAYGGRTEWRLVARDTLRFVLRDLRVGQGYASSLDADAGGTEGSHVTWTMEELRDALGTAGQLDHLAAVSNRWRIESPGLFEGRSIPRLAVDEPFETPHELAGALRALRAARARRVQPGRDDKIILEWNAMLASALLLMGEDEFDVPGVDLLASLATSHFVRGTWWRTEQCRAFATASDIAWLLDARLDAFERTGDDQWLSCSRELAGYLLDHFWDGEVPSSRAPNVGQGLFAQSDLVTDLPARTKEIFDGATPSSHAVACRALARFALCTGDADHLAIAQRLVHLGATLVVNHPAAVPDLVEAAGFALEGVEIVIPGPPNELSDHVRCIAMPRSVLVTGSGWSPLLVARAANWAYVCRGGVCQLPVRSWADLSAQLPLGQH